MGVGPFDHDTLTGDQIHVPHAMTFADAAARLAATPAASMVGRLAFQTDTGTLWILLDDSPLTWAPVSVLAVDVTAPEWIEAVYNTVRDFLSTTSNITETDDNTANTILLTGPSTSFIKTSAWTNIGVLTFLDEASDPAAPAAGAVILYAKDSGGGASHLYIRDSAGTVTDLISALSAALNDLTDVNTAGVADGNVLTYDSGTSTWLPAAPAASSGGASQLDSAVGHRFPLMAHRGDIGSSDSYPENTIEALRQAILKGADAVELDVRLSSDSTFWVIHDSTVDRTTSATGNVSAKTDANMAALDIDGGFGYDAGRHGTSLNVPKLIDVIDALEPYDAVMQIQLNASSDPNATALANLLMTRGRPSRYIIEVSTLTEAAAIKAVSPLLAVLVNNSVSGAAASADVDWLSVERSTLTNLAFSTALAPKRIRAYTSITDYGDANEATWFQQMYDRGATSFSCNNLDLILPLRKALLFTEAGSIGLIDDLTDVDTATVPPTSGDVLAFDGTNWVPADPSTVGGGAYPWIDDNVNPQEYPISPSAVDDEFEDSSLDVAWTKVNDPSAGDAISESRYAGFINFGLAENTGTDNFDALVRLHRTPPAGAAVAEYVARIALVVTDDADATDGAEFGSLGIYLGNSVNDEAVGAGIEINVGTLTAPFTLKGFQATAGTLSGSGAAGHNVYMPGEFIYVKLAKTTAAAYTSSNTYKIYASGNGITWHYIATITKTFTTACDEFGIYGRRPKSVATTPRAEALVDFVRRTV